MSQPVLPWVFQAIALPPGPSIALFFLTLLSRRKNLRMFFFALGFSALYLSSIPITARWLMGRVDVFAPVSLESSAAEAIVVLGAERRNAAPEYGGDTLGILGLERVRYAARLAKRTGLPILVSGGSLEEDEVVSEAELMGSVLKEFGLEARWVEGKSKNTFENAVYSSQILKSVGIGEVFLVTQGWHMTRAVEAFEYAGMRVIPAPTGMLGPNHKTDFRDFLPSATALQSTSWVCHEMLGRWWYHYRYYRSSGQ